MTRIIVNAILFLSVKLQFNLLLNSYDYCIRSGSWKLVGLVENTSIQANETSGRPSIQVGGIECGAL